MKLDLIGYLNLYSENNKYRGYNVTLNDISASCLGSTEEKDSRCIKFWSTSSNSQAYSQNDGFGIGNVRKFVIWFVAAKPCSWFT